MSFGILIGTCADQDPSRLILTLKPQLEGFDRIMVMDDYSSSQEQLDKYKDLCSNLFVVSHKLKNSFSEHWNYGLSLMDYKTWTIKLDADEIVGDKFIAGLYKEIYEQGKCKSIGLINVNTLYGEVAGEVWPPHLQHCQKGYTSEVPKIDTNLVLTDPDYATRAGIMAWPDVHTRAWINMPDIYYVGRVHEHLNITADHVSYNPDTFIYHHKHFSNFEKRLPLYAYLESLQAKD